MSTNYPERIDTDIEIQTIRNNIAEIGSTTINSIKSAVIAIERYLGTATGSTLSITQRINNVIDNDGRLRRSAIETAGFITAPITNSDIDDNAEIDESKLDLDYSTQSLQDQINTIRMRQDSNTTEILSLATTIANHISSSKIGAHLSTNISYDPTSNTYYGTPAASPFFDDSINNVQLAISQNTEIIRLHKEAPFGEHYASAIFFDNNDVSGITSATDVQEGLEDALNLNDANFNLHRDEMHANGIIRNTRTCMAEASCYKVDLTDNTLTFVAGSSRVDFNDGALNLRSEFVSNGDTIVISGSANDEDDGEYQVDRVDESDPTRLFIVGTFRTDSGAGASADIYLSSLEGGSPVEWSCNVLNCTEHHKFDSPASHESTEVFVSHPMAAAVIGGEINFANVAQEIDSGNVEFQIVYNQNAVNMDFSGTLANTYTYIDTTGTYEDLIESLTIENIVRTINKTAVQNHYPFHAYIKDGNQLAIAHDFVDIDVTTPESPTLTDTIQIRSGAFLANSFDITLLGFQTGQIGVSTSNPATTNYSYPNFNNAYVVNGSRRRTIRCLTENGSANYVLARVDNAVIDNITTADGVTTLIPRDLELREGDVLRVKNSLTVDGEYTIDSVGAANFTIRDNTGVTEDARICIYRNVITVEQYDQASGMAALSRDTLYRVAIDEEGSVFKHVRLDYRRTAGAYDHTKSLKIINCSRTLAGSSNGVTYTLATGGAVSDTYGSGTQTFDPSDYNSLYDSDGSETTRTLQFDHGEIVQIDEFNTGSFGNGIQVYRLFSVNKVDWIDVKVDYDQFLANAATTITVTVYEEVDEERNLLLGTALHTLAGKAPSGSDGRFSSIVDERYFGTLGYENIRTDVKEILREVDGGIGNYILNGLNVAYSVANTILYWSGGSAIINGHRVDFDSGTIDRAHMAELVGITGAPTAYFVLATEYGEIKLFEMLDGRPEEEYVLLAMILVDDGSLGGTAGDATILAHAADFTNLNEKIKITVSPDPSQGLFTSVKDAVDYANVLSGITTHYHDKLKSLNTVGAIAGPTGVVDSLVGADVILKAGTHLVAEEISVDPGVSLIGEGQAIVYIEGDFTAATNSSVFTFNAGRNNVKDIIFSVPTDNTKTIIPGAILYFDTPDYALIEGCSSFVYEDATPAANDAIESIITVSGYDTKQTVIIRNNELGNINYVINISDIIDNLTIKDNILFNGNTASKEVIYLNKVKNVEILNNLIEVLEGLSATNNALKIEGTVANDTENINVVGNTFSTYDQYDIIVSDVFNINIVDNHFIGTTTGTSNGVYYINSMATENVKVAENSFTKCGGNVYFDLYQNLDNVIITSNIMDVDSGGSENIYFNVGGGTPTASDVEIVGNVINNAETSNIALLVNLADIILKDNIVSATNTTSANLGVLCSTMSNFVFSENILSAVDTANISILILTSLSGFIAQQNKIDTGNNSNLIIASAAVFSDVIVSSNIMISTTSTLTRNNIYMQGTANDLVNVFVFDNQVTSTNGRNISISNTSGLENVKIERNVLESGNTAENIDIDVGAAATISKLSISDNMMECGGNNIDIDADTLSNTLINDNIINNTGAGDNVEITSTTAVNDLTMVGNQITNSASGGRNIDLDVVDLFRFVFSENLLTCNASNNISMVVSSEASYLWIIENYIENTGSTAQAVVFNVLTLSYVWVGENYIESDDMAALNLSFGAYLYIYNNLIITTGAIVAGGSITMNGGLLVYIENNLISAVDMNAVRFTASVSDLHFVDNITTNTSSSQYTLYFTGVSPLISGGFTRISGNYMVNSSTSEGNIVVNGVISQPLNITNNVLRSGGNGGGLQGNIYFNPGANNISNVSIIENTIYGGSNANIYLYAPNINTFDKFIISDNFMNSINSDANVFFTGNAAYTITNAIVSTNIMERTGAGRSFYVVNIAGTKWNIDGNVMEINTGSFDTCEIANVQYLNIVNNYMKNSSVGGVLELDTCTDVNINGNMFESGGGTALDFDTIDGFLMENNHHIGPSGADAIDLASDCDNGIIAGNIFNGYDSGRQIIGALLSAANYLDSIHIADNWPKETDLTFRTATDAATDSGGATSLSYSWQDGGGGTIWVDGISPAPGGNKLLDDSIDWKNRYISMVGTFRNAATKTYLPTGSLDDQFYGFSMEDAIGGGAGFVANYIVVSHFYSESGAAAGSMPYGPVYDDGSGLPGAEGLQVVVYVDNSGHLRMWKNAGLATSDFGEYTLKISYSPKKA